MVKIHVKDMKILRELDFDARQPISQIARTIGLSTEVTAYRIKQLEQKGIIKRYYPVIDISKLGYLFCRFRLVVENLNSQIEEEIIQLAKENSKFHVEIIEPNLETYFINKNNIKSHRIKLENFIQNTKRRYDVIVLLDVLEHFENPEKIIEGIKVLLKDKGLVVVSLPNYKSLMAYLSKSWAWWMVEDHKYHFSPNSINLYNI